MKAAILSNRPPYKLMKQSDIVSFYHLQMPRWLFCDKRYKTLSLESKVAYTFLLNRFQLSKMNGWVNSDGEVFIIFTRESLAEEIGISYRKAIACFKELLAANLIWEQRIGRGNANHIYLAAVELSEQDAEAHSSAPFSPKRVVRSHLQRIDGMVILDTREKLRSNIGARIKNSTAYIMATLFNNICEHQSDLMVDSYLNSISTA